METSQILHDSSEAHVTSGTTADAVRLLIVDDQPEQLRIYERMLAGRGMEIQTTSDPRAASRILKTFPADVVLVDMYMPICSGPELAKKLCDDPHFEGISIVYLSAEEDPMLQLVALEFAGEHFLSKPVRPQLLARVVNLYAERSRQRRKRQAQRGGPSPQADRIRRGIDAHTMMSVTDDQGIITYVSDKFCEVSGYSRDELIGHTHRMLKSGIHPATFYAELWGTLGQGKIWRGEICNRSRDGELYWIDTTVMPFPAEGGLPAQYVSVQTGISRQKRIERELVAAKSSAEAANQAKSEFLASASHEFRTPLNVILGYAEILRGNPSLNDEARDQVAMIEAAGKQVLSLVDGLIDLSRFDSDRATLTLQTMSLDIVLHSAMIAAATPAQARGITLVDAFDENARVTVLTEPIRLRQAVLNLLTNGVKFNRPGGSVRLVCDPVRDGRVRIAVEDDGLGIAADRHTRVFTAFDRLGAERSKAEGIGTGLALAKRIVEALGGKIGFQSDEGQGSTFWIDLPVGKTPLEEKSLFIDDT